jgi:hypothetical protein
MFDQQQSNPDQQYINARKDRYQEDSRDPRDSLLHNSEHGVTVKRAQDQNSRNFGFCAKRLPRHPKLGIFDHQLVGALPIC